MVDFFGLAAATLAVIAVAAFFSGVLHGATGMAGGVVMAALLSHLVGIKVAIPVMTVALILSHGSRILFYWRDINWPVARRVLLSGLPMTAVGALIFTVLDPSLVALVFAAALSLSFPVKYWAQRRQRVVGPKTLALASCVWGVLAGNVIGPGFFLAPFLLGTGMNRLTFVGTLALVTLFMNLLKLSVFGVTDYMNTQWFVLGLLVGLLTIPGNWAGRTLLQRMSDKHHSHLVDLMTLIVIGNFIYLAVV